MSHIFSSKRRAAKKQEEEAARQAALLRQQQQTASTAQRKPSLGALNANHQIIGKRPSKTSLTNVNADPWPGYPQQSQFGYPQQSQYVRCSNQEIMGPPPQGWVQPQQQWVPNGYGQQPGPTMMPIPQSYQAAPGGQRLLPPQQEGAPWGPSAQQYPGPGYPGQGFPGQGYPPFQPLQPNFQPQQPQAGSGRRASGGGLTGSGMKRISQQSLSGKASQQSLSRRASGDGQLTVGSIVEQMQDCVDKKKLEPKFYNTQSIVARARGLYQGRAPQLVKQAWNLSDDEASEMGILGLFDVWVLGDDSNSMLENNNPGREQDLKNYVTRIAKAGTLFDADGINVDFFHSAGAEGVKNEAEVNQLFAYKKNSSGTPIGYTLETKILSKIRRKVDANMLEKPVLVLILTDGAPFNDGPPLRLQNGYFTKSGNLRGKDAENYICKVIKDMVDFLESKGYPAGAVNYMFAQVGDDSRAQSFLGRMDNAPGIAHVVDATSSYEAESAEVDGHLTVAGYLLKLLLGAISPKRDAVDNRRRGSKASSRKRMV